MSDLQALRFEDMSVCGVAFGLGGQIPARPLSALPPSCPARKNVGTRRFAVTMTLIDRLLGRDEQIDPDFDVAEQQKAGVPAISVRNLYKVYKSRNITGTREERRAKKLVTALGGISFDVMSGQIFGLLGPNSSGKSTAMRCVATLSAIDKGFVEIYGVDVKERPYMARQLFGYVFQSAGLDKVLTGREHLELFADLAHLDRKTRKRNIEAVVDLLGLGEFIDRQTKGYSGGIIRRIDLAIALLHQPAVLILDEPTTGLDLETRSTIWGILQTLRDNGTGILISSHYLEEIDILADSVAVMDRGIIVAQGNKSDLKNALGGNRATVRIDEFTDLAVSERAGELLKAKGIVSSFNVNRLRGNCIEAVISRDDTSIDSKIRSALADIGFGNLFSISQSRPSLDDVYLEATGKKIEDADRDARIHRDRKSEMKESMI